MRISLVLVALTILVPAAARAQSPDPEDDPRARPGVDLALRTGFALPFGKADADATQSLSDELNGGIPIIVEAAARFNELASAGVMVQFVPGLVKNTSTNNCGNGIDCSAMGYHVAVEGLFHFPQGGIIPWVGVGTGYEWFSLTASANGNSATGSASGFEFLILQAGLEGRVTPQLSLGGFVMFSLAQYGSESLSMGGNSVSSDVTNTSIHQWLTLGVRGTVGL